jgi:hypothetical protein
LFTACSASQRSGLLPDLPQPGNRGISSGLANHNAVLIIQHNNLYSWLTYYTGPRFESGPGYRTSCARCLNVPPPPLQPMLELQLGWTIAISFQITSNSSSTLPTAHTQEDCRHLLRSTLELSTPLWRAIGTEHTALEGNWN